MLAAALASFLVGPAFADPAPATGPGFDCAKANGAIETAICVNPGLAARDRTMARLYGLVQIDALRVGPSAEKATQRAFLAQRDKDCAKAVDVGKCVATDDDARLEELAVAALVRSPAVALAELRREDPARAKLYEAIEVMATAPESPERARTVAMLVGPEYSRLNAGHADMLGDIKSADDAAASYESFDIFIDLTGVDLGHALILPCEAIVRRPKLIHALDAMYGSSIDNQLGGSDCAVMLPPPPHFAALTNAALDTASDGCTSTSRYGALRNYARLLIQAQLRRIDEEPKPDQITVRSSIRWRAEHAAQLAAVIAELNDYDAKELHTVNPRDSDPNNPKWAMTLVIDDAFDVCDQ